jgi:ketosteroid isomerase-like protein
MFKRLSILIACVATFAWSPVAAQTPDEQEVLKVQQSRLAAAQAQDIAALERMVADELQYCHTTGAIDTKASYLDTVRTGRIRWVEVKPSGMKARVYGNTAVVTGRLDQKITTGANATPTDMAIRTIDIYVKRDGRWQLTDFQASSIAAARPAAAR